MSSLVTASCEALSEGGALARQLDAFVPRPAQLRLTGAIAETIRDGHWGARSVSNVRGGTLEIPARVWLGLEAERGRMEFPFDEAPDDEPDDGLFPAYRNGHADIQMQLSGDRQNA